MKKPYTEEQIIKAIKEHEEALIARYGTLGRATDRITLRSANGLVFTSKQFTKTAYQYRLKQEFIRPHTPQKNGMVERLLRSNVCDFTILTRWKKPD